MLASARLADHHHACHVGQAIKTDTQGIVAGDAVVAIGGYQMPVYETRPANATNAPIVIVISEIWVERGKAICTSGSEKASNQASLVG